MNMGGLRAYRGGLDREKASYFDDWPIEPEQREACWATLARCLDALIALGPDATREQATEVFRRCVEAYNDLDDGFICTIEREELCDILDTIGDLSGMDLEEDWIDEWRDW